MSNKFQNEDFKSAAELASAGGTSSQLLNTSKIYSQKSAGILESLLRKNNDSALVAPTVTDDSSQGYEVGSRWIDTLSQKVYVNFANTVGAAIWKEAGSSGFGSADTFVLLNASEQLTDWSKGNNAAFLGGGAFAGTFVKETVSPLNGDASYKNTQVVGSLNDYLASPIQSVPVRFRGNICSLIFPYNYNGGAADIVAVVYDVTNAIKLTDDTIHVMPNTPITGSVFKANIFIPSNCTQVRIGFQVKVLNDGKILDFDDIQLTADVTKYLNVLNGRVGEIATFATSDVPSNFLLCDGSAVSRGTYSDLFAKIGITHGQGDGSTTFNLPDYRGRFLRGTANGSTNDPDRATRTAMNAGGNTGDNVGSVQGHQIASHRHSMQLAFDDPNPRGSGGSTDVWQSSGSVDQTAFTGGNETRPVNAYVNFYICFTSGNNISIVQQSETVSSDTIQFQYANAATYDLATLPDSPIGTYITYTYAASSNTRVQTSGANRPTQTDSDMSINGVQLFAKAFTAPSNSASPTVFAINIGKGYNGLTLLPFKSAGKVTRASLDVANYGSSQFGARFKHYDPITGVLLLDAGFNATSVTSANFDCADATVQNNCYITFTASKNPALTGLNLNNVAASYTSNSGQVISTSLTLINYEDTVFDTHNSYSSGIYTVPETGVYDISAAVGTASVNLTGVQSLVLYLYINGSEQLRNLTRGSNSSSVHTCNLQTKMQLTKGQTISVYSNCSASTTLNTLYNNLSIAKISVG